VRDSLGIPGSLLVLGGTSDLATAIAKTLVARGTRRVVLAGRDREALQHVAESIGTAGQDVKMETAEFDALDSERHEPFVDEVFDSGGDIDAVLIAFAEYGDRAAIEEDAAAARRLFEVNLTGAVSVTTPLVKRLREQGHGVLVVLSSTAAEHPRAGEYAYAASKAGLDAYFRGLGDRLAGSGVGVMVVRPGFVPTAMTAGRRSRPWATTPDAVGEAVARGLERDAEIVWVPAALRWVMAGVRLLPRPVFRRLNDRMESRDLA
jgi:decaprenylphospho-beta-D-erythro-pentofuranosid-2-ulose 2-reductase